MPKPTGLRFLQRIAQRDANPAGTSRNPPSNLSITSMIMPVPKPLRLAIIVALVSPAFVSAAESADTSVRELITRFAPAQAENFVLETIPAVGGRDAYEVESRDGKIILR